MAEDKEGLYLRLLEQLRHLEGRAFATLGNFLTANAFAFVAWATFYQAHRSEFGGIDPVLIALAIAGYLGGLAWALLGARNWEYCRRIVGELIRVGGSYEKGKRGNLYQVLRGLEESVHAAWTPKVKLGPLSYYATVVSQTPLIVALLYLAMLVTLLVVRKASILGSAPWFLAVLCGAVGLFFAGVAFYRCQGSSIDAEQAIKDAKQSVELKEQQHLCAASAPESSARSQE